MRETFLTRLLATKHIAKSVLAGVHWTFFNASTSSATKRRVMHRSDLAHTSVNVFFAFRTERDRLTETVVQIEGELREYVRHRSKRVLQTRQNRMVPATHPPRYTVGELSHACGVTSHLRMRRRWRTVLYCAHDLKSAARAWLRHDVWRR